MANNCNNWITLNGNVSEIKEFSKLLEIGENQENGYDIYANLCNEFGKSENDGRWFDISVTNENENEMTISGDSAWCPCLELFTKISEKYPSFEIHYEYEEPGCDFAGFADISEGNCNDNQFTYWEGKAVNDYDYAFQSAFEDVSCYCDEDETEEAFIDSDLYKAFKPEEQKELLEEFKRMTAEQKETEETNKSKEIEAAKQLLKENGYYTDNLWTIHDVKAKFKCSDDEAQKVLHDALKNDATMEQINFSIGWHGEESGLEKIEEND